MVLGQDEATAIISDNDGIYIIKSTKVTKIMIKFLILSVVTIRFNPTTYQVLEGQVVNFMIELIGDSVITNSVMFTSNDGSAICKQSLHKAIQPPWFYSVLSTVYCT